MRSGKDRDISYLCGETQTTEFIGNSSTYLIADAATSKQKLYIYTNLRITLLFLGQLHMFSPDSPEQCGQARQSQSKTCCFSLFFSFSHLSPAPAWALQGDSSLGNGHLHGLKWVPCLGSGRTFFSFLLLLPLRPHLFCS